MSETSPPAEDNLMFEANLDLEEDLVAELENFLLHVRLKVTVDALEIVDNVLWRHLHHFPVFAEVAGFLIELGDRSRISSMLLVLNAGIMSNYVLDWDATKMKFLFIVRTYNSGKLRDLILSVLGIETRSQAATSLSYQEGEAQPSLADEELHRLLTTPKFSSPTEVKERLNPTYSVANWSRCKALKYAWRALCCPAQTGDL